jgi:hypothetical protein
VDNGAEWAIGWYNVASDLIDVWDAKTFDDELSAVMATQAAVIRDYVTTDNQIFLAYDLGRSNENYFYRPENPYASAFFALEEAVAQLMQSRTMRAWHYTRLTAAEVDKLRNEGIQLSTPETLRTRLDLLVASGALSPQMADELYAGSPFHSDQLAARSGKFWMSSHPVAVRDSGVQPLMARWGGEVASMWTKDPVLLAPLAVAGKARVIELSVPLSLTRHSLSAGQAVVATFGRTLGCALGKHSFDLYVTRPLGPDSVLRVHGEDDSSFHAIGLTIPDGYLDVDIGHWKELTGEDD